MCSYCAVDAEFTVSTNTRQQKKLILIQQVSANIFSPQHCVKTNAHRALKPEKSKVDLKIAVWIKVDFNCRNKLNAHWNHRKCCKMERFTSKWSTKYLKGKERRALIVKEQMRTGKRYFGSSKTLKFAMLKHFIHSRSLYGISYFVCMNQNAKIGKQMCLPKESSNQIHTFHR